MNTEPNPLVDKYLIDGCMRCPYGGTPQCKVNNWRAELALLRQIVLETGLQEALKWGAPVYTHEGKNIVSVTALKESATIGFFKGVLLTDNHNILQQQGNLQSGRIIRFTNARDIEQARDLLKAYILEAIDIEASGQKVAFNKNPEPVPDALARALENDPAFKQAFYALTPGRQRGYIIYFSQPKQEKTRLKRIEQYKAHIMNGIGLHDR